MVQWIRQGWEGATLARTLLQCKQCGEKSRHINPHSSISEEGGNKCPEGAKRAYPIKDCMHPVSINPSKSLFGIDRESLWCWMSIWSHLYLIQNHQDSSDVRYCRPALHITWLGDIRLGRNKASLSATILEINFISMLINDAGWFGSLPSFGRILI